MSGMEVQIAYGWHGRYNSDEQDQVFDDAFPGFFRPDTLNLLGIEDAGVFSDSERDKTLMRSVASPTFSPVYIGDPDLPPELRFRYQGNILTEIMRTRGNSAVLTRSSFLLEKWNRDHPDMPVYGYNESYPTEAIQERIRTISEKISIALTMREKSKFHWRALATQLREHSEMCVSVFREREENWVRMLRELPESLPEPLRIRAAAGIRILITIGESHRLLTRRVTEGVGDKYVVYPDILLPSPNCHRYVHGTNHYRLMRGEDIPDEDWLRDFYLGSQLTVATALARQEATSFCAHNHEYVARLVEWVRGLSIDEIARDLSLKSGELAGDLFPGGERPLVELSSTDMGLSGMRECATEDEAKEFDGVEPLVDRDDHPNNIYIDKFYVAISLCVMFGITDPDDTVYSLLKQALDNYLESEPRVMLTEMRKEAFLRVTAPELPPFRGKIPIEIPEGFMPVTPTLYRFVSEIAEQSPESPILWDIGDSDEFRGASKNLISMAKTATTIK